jgi:hypothetical protein
MANLIKIVEFNAGGNRTHSTNSLSLRNFRDWTKAQAIKKNRSMSMRGIDNTVDFASFEGV